MTDFYLSNHGKGPGVARIVYIADGRIVLERKAHAGSRRWTRFELPESFLNSTVCGWRDAGGRGVVDVAGAAGDEMKQFELKDLAAQVALEKFRTRWRRWLGNKTRLGYPYWVTLLDSRWSGWVYRVYEDCGLEGERINVATTDALQLRALWRTAIDHADMNMLQRLDGLYATEKAGL